MVKSYSQYLKEKGKSNNTIISYTNDINKFFDELNINPDDYVTETDIRKWINQMLQPEAGHPMAVSTIKRRLYALRSFYRWAAANKYVMYNPMNEIGDPKTADEDQEKIMWLTEDQFESLLERMRQTPVLSRTVDPEEKYRRDRAIVYLLAYAGLRVSELSNLRITDLDLEMKRIRIIGKGNKIRTNPIPNVLYLEIMDWLKYRIQKAKVKSYIDESPFVFYSQRSKKLSVRAIESIIEGYSSKDKKLTPHMFRHTFCKWMLKATKNDVEKVRRLAGHSSIKTTVKYLKDSYSDLADAVEMLPKF